MDCPVCNHKGIPEASRVCPNCQADLTMFKNIRKLNEDIRLKRNIIFSFAFLVVLLVVFLGYMFLFSEGFSSRYTRMEIQAKNNEIIELKKQNSELRQQIFNMQQGNGSLADTAGSGYQRVIPSADEEDPIDMSRIKDTRRTTEKVSGQQPDDDASEDPEINYYRVKAGETLYSIAKKQYGDGNKYRKIMKDNNIEDPSQVKVGMRLKIIK